MLSLRLHFSSGAHPFFGRIEGSSIKGAIQIGWRWLSLTAAPGGVCGDVWSRQCNALVPNVVGYGRLAAAPHFKAELRRFLRAGVVAPSTDRLLSTG